MPRVIIFCLMLARQCLIAARFVAMRLGTSRAVYFWNIRRDSPWRRIRQGQRFKARSISRKHGGARMRQPINRAGIQTCGLGVFEVTASSERASSRQQEHPGCSHENMAPALNHFQVMSHGILMVVGLYSCTAY